LGDVKEPSQVDRRDRREIIERVLRERLADVDAGVVDQRVDPPEPIASLIDRSSRGLRIGDVAGDRDVIALVSIGRRERPRNADDGIPGTAVSRDKPGTDAVGRAGNDRHRGSLDKVGLVDPHKMSFAGQASRRGGFVGHTVLDLRLRRPVRNGHVKSNKKLRRVLL